MPDFLKLIDLRDRARSLADDLLGVQPRGGFSSSTCFDSERDRPLTVTECTRGWKSRPFEAYDPSRMCEACQACWHAELAARAMEGFFRSLRPSPGEDKT